MDYTETIPVQEVCGAQSVSIASRDEGYAAQFAFQRVERDSATQAGSLSRIAK